MNEEAFTREVEACERTMYRVSVTILGHDADCCDAVQEALTKAWQHRNQVDERYFRTWLMRILINECHNIGRRRARVTVMERMPEQIAPEAEDTGLSEAMAKLKEPHRLVLALHYLEGFRLNEIAGMTGVPLGTVKYRIAQARKALRAYMTIDEEGGRRQ